MARAVVANGGDQIWKRLCDFLGIDYDRPIIRIQVDAQIDRAVEVRVTEYVKEHESLTSQYAKTTAYRLVPLAKSIEEEKT